MNDSRGHCLKLWAGWLLAAAASGGLGMAVGCGGGDAAGPKTARNAAPSEGLTHEACGGGRSETLDTNGDGKPDITKYYESSGREACRVVDLNHDGRPDLYEYFDAAGQVRRREFCYDDSGSVNAIEQYANGRLTQRVYDIAGQHRVDTWDWFDPNAPVDPTTGRPAHPTRRERDSRGDGHIDQWWTWNGDQLTIAVDRDGDGKPDPEATLVFSVDGGAPVPVATDAPPAAPSASAATPTSANGAAPAPSNSAPAVASGAAASPQGAGTPPPIAATAPSANVDGGKR